jgi:hypothetical protein
MTRYLAIRDNESVLVLVRDIGDTVVYPNDRNSTIWRICRSVGNAWVKEVSIIFKQKARIISRDPWLLVCEYAYKMWLLMWRQICMYF